jgi:hypothetical protein
MRPLLVKVAVDGFAAGTWKTDWNGMTGLPTGRYEMQVLAGSHRIEMIGDLGPGAYFFLPVVIEPRTAPDSTYVIRLRPGGSMRRGGYNIEYAGWSDAEAARWPRESLVANPLF